jgi:hypothetical protein
MPALINNYTTTQPTVACQQNTVIVRYLHQNLPINNSIIISWENQIGLNNKILKLLDDYSLLRDNWDEEGGIAPTNNVIKKAKFIAAVLEKHGQPIFHAAPGPNGEIMLDLRNNKKSRSLELIFYPHKTVSVLFPEEGKPTQHIFDDQKLPNLLQWVNKK